MKTWPDMENPLRNPIWLSLIRVFSSECCVSLPLRRAANRSSCSHIFFKIRVCWCLFLITFQAWRFYIEQFYIEHLQWLILCEQFQDKAINYDTSVVVRVTTFTRFKYWYDHTTRPQTREALSREWRIEKCNQHWYNVICNIDTMWGFFHLITGWIKSSSFV